MNKLINRYLIFGFLKTVGNVILVFIALGIILNLFEEIEFFKDLNISIALPIILSISYVPSLIVELLPFIIFISAMWYFIAIKGNSDFLSAKIFGYSNLKIILILSCTAFIFGSFILLAVNPFTSSMVKYYEKIKAQHSKDVDHLISINKNGVWIKEKSDSNLKIITAKSLEGEYLQNLSIYIVDSENKIIKRIEAEKARIINNPWLLENVVIYNFINEQKITKEASYEFNSANTLGNITSLYKNLDTLSFISLITEYNILNKKGYSKKLLNEKINRFISMPVFLFIMVLLASIFTVGSTKNKQNFYFVLVSILTCVVIFYFKDLSIALGQTEKISLTLSVWMPVVAVSLFCSIGIIQINEK